MGNYMTVKLKLLGIILLLLQSWGLAAQLPTAEQQIQEASKVYEQALTQKNEPLLKSILADNFILTTASGKVLTKKRHAFKSKQGGNEVQ